MITVEFEDEVIGVWKSQQTEPYDTHLIAAAPDLLEACELAKIFLANQIGEETRYNNTIQVGILERYYAKICEAIAKAKGEL